MRLELSDLPPRYQAQALEQLAKRKKAENPAGVAAKVVAEVGKDFDSRGEYEFYLGTIAPKVSKGEIVAWSAHPAFPLFPAGEYCGIKLPPIRYTADFRLEYADGTVEIVEVKSKFVRRMQRDYIKKGLFLRITQVDLPRRGKRKNSYKKVEKKEPARAPAGESIEQRPAEVKSREQFGHWEMDTVYSAKSSSKKALLVLTERKTRWEIIILIPNRKAETIVKALDALERRYGAVNFRKIFRSITVDNGSEFAEADGLERSAINKTLPRTKVYFCHPYSSWERGSNENQNLMIRRKHPKGTDFAKVTKAQIEETAEWINNYPRRILGYMSSEIMFKQCLQEIGLVA